MALITASLRLDSELLLVPVYRSGALLPVMILMAANVAAASPDREYTRGSVVSPDEIKELLESGDSRQAAWGAWFASQGGGSPEEDEYVTIMARRLAEWNSPGQLGALDRDAISEILYALIERSQSVPVVSLQAVMQGFPTETMILAARLPVEDRKKFLQKWYDLRESGRGIYLRGIPSPAGFAWIAALILSKTPPEEFAAGIFSNVGERLSFSVTDGAVKEAHQKVKIPLPCDERDQEHPLPAGDRQKFERWPPLWQYEIIRDDAPFNGPLLVEAGGMQIRYRRLSKWTWSRGCSTPQEGEEAMRFTIIAQMVGSDAGTALPHARRDFIYVWGNVEGYSQALKRSVSEEKATWKTALRTLQQKGYLTDEEVKHMPPKLEVYVSDQRTRIADRGGSHTLPALPRFRLDDERTTVFY